MPLGLHTRVRTGGIPIDGLQFLASAVIEPDAHGGPKQPG